MQSPIVQFCFCNEFGVRFWFWFRHVEESVSSTKWFGRFALLRISSAGSPVQYVEREPNVTDEW